MRTPLEVVVVNSCRPHTFLNTRLLSSTAGYGLVIKEHDPSNRRRLMCRLSPKGEALIKQLKATIYG